MLIINTYYVTNFTNLRNYTQWHHGIWSPKLTPVHMITAPLQAHTELTIRHKVVNHSLPLDIHPHICINLVSFSSFKEKSKLQTEFIVFSFQYQYLLLFHVITKLNQNVVSRWLYTFCDVGSASTAIGKAKNYPGMMTEPLCLRHTPLRDARPLCYAQPTEQLLLYMAILAR